MPAAPDVIADGGTKDASRLATDDAGDAAADSSDDVAVEPVDAGLCGYSVGFTEWSVTASQGIYIKGGICIPTGSGDVPKCAQAAPCGCFNATTSSPTPMPVVYASNAGDVTRTPFDTSVSGGGICP